MRKWLNIENNESDYSADPSDDDEDDYEDESCNDIGSEGDVESLLLSCVVILY